MRMAIIVLAGLALLTGCSGAQGVKTAETAINIFHRSLNANQSAAIYSAASADMKRSTTPHEFGQLLAAIHRKLGLYRSGKMIGWNNNYTTGGEFVTINFTATYDHGTAQEGFVYRVMDKGVALVGYHVNSKALIVN